MDWVTLGWKVAADRHFLAFVDMQMVDGSFSGDRRPSAMVLPPDVLLSEGPSRHFVGHQRSPFANSPTTQVHSPDPNLIGCDVIWGGIPAPFCSTYDFMASMCFSMP